MTQIFTIARQTNLPIDNIIKVADFTIMLDGVLNTGSFGISELNSENSMSVVDNLAVPTNTYDGIAMYQNIISSSYDVAVDVFDINSNDDVSGIIVEDGINFQTIGFFLWFSGGITNAILYDLIGEGSEYVNETLIITTPEQPFKLRLILKDNTSKAYIDYNDGAGWIIVFDYAGITTPATAKVGFGSFWLGD